MAAFRAVSYPTRVYSGTGAVEQLAGELRRLGASRAFVISGRSIGADERNRGRIEAALGSSFAGWNARIEKDSTYASVAAATDQARDAGTDLVVAVGGGSVIVAARALAIFLAEHRDPFEIMTQYPEGKPAVSPRLDAPKPPIINIVTTPTTAMNRAGTGLKNDELDHRMEYFDPKTRPAALFWDDELLAATPLEVYRSAATTIFNAAVMGLGALSGNPLADGDRRQVFRLAIEAYPGLGTAADGPQLRLDLMAVAFLLNRLGDITELDAVGTRERYSARAYALATALHLRYPQVGQGEATAVMSPAALRRYPLDLDRLRPIADGLSLSLSATAGADEAADAIAASLLAIYQAAGVPTRLRDLDVPREDFALLAAETQKNFNANPGARDPNEIEEMLTLLQAAW